MKDCSKKIGTIMLIITNSCNLKCTYCYQGDRENRVMKVDTAKEVLSTYLNNTEEFSFINIVLFGGEPFLYFSIIKEICEWVWSKEWGVDYIFNFSTNGTLLKEESKEWLKINAERILLTLSADGTMESQNINRSNSFELIDFSFFSDTWKNPFVKMTISEETLCNLAKDVIFFHERGFQFSECNLAVGIDWSKEENSFLLDRELSKLVEFYKNHPEIEPAPILKMDFWLCEGEKRKIKKCGIGTSVVAIDCDGKAYPCNFVTPMSLDSENIKTLMDIDYSNIDLIIDEECFNKCYLFPVCPTCYAGDFQKNRKLKMKDHSICKLVKIRAYYSAMLRAERIKSDWSKNQKRTIEEKMRLQLEVRAIKKILSK